MSCLVWCLLQIDDDQLELKSSLQSSQLLRKILSTSMLCVRIVHMPADTMHALVNRQTHMIGSQIHSHLYTEKTWGQVRLRFVFDFSFYHQPKSCYVLLYVSKLIIQFFPWNWRNVVIIFALVLLHNVNCRETALRLEQKTSISLNWRYSNALASFRTLYLKLKSITVLV